MVLPHSGDAGLRPILQHIHNIPMSALHKRGLLGRGLLVLDFAAGNVDHELGELGGVARKFGALRWHGVSMLDSRPDARGIEALLYSKEPTTRAYAASGRGRDWRILRAYTRRTLRRHPLCLRLRPIFIDDATRSSATTARFCSTRR